MNTKLMAGAFLTYKDKVLVMHRGLHRELNPGLWAPIGGHIEPEEINKPAQACLREIEEETQIKADKIKNFSLKYITVRNNSGLIYINYVFLGDLVEQCELPFCDEGTLHWIDFRSLPDYPMSFSAQQVILHYQNNPENHNVFVGAVNSANTKIFWSEL